jgi:hypothetical protein
LRHLSRARGSPASLNKRRVCRIAGCRQGLTMRPRRGSGASCRVATRRGARGARQRCPTLRPGPSIVPHTGPNKEPLTTAQPARRLHGSTKEAIQEASAKAAPRRASPILGTSRRAHPAWAAEATVRCFEAGGFHPNSIFCDGLPRPEAANECLVAPAVDHSTKIKELLRLSSPTQRRGPRCPSGGKPPFSP